jgi:hypothetical protein
MLIICIITPLEGGSDNHGDNDDDDNNAAGGASAAVAGDGDDEMDVDLPSNKVCTFLFLH